MFSAQLPPRAENLAARGVGPSAHRSFHSPFSCKQPYFPAFSAAGHTQKSRVAPFTHQPQLESASKIGLSTPLSADLEERGQSRTLLLPKREPPTRVTACSFVGYHQSITHLPTLSHLAVHILGFFFLSFPLRLKQVLCRLVATKTLTQSHL